MNQRYCQDLDLPFALNTYFLDKIRNSLRDPNRGTVFNVPENDHDPIISGWLFGLGFYLAHVEVFYVAPGGRGKIHVDGTDLADRCKLNWVYGAHGSLMEWYEPKDSRIPPKINRTNIGTNYVWYEPDVVRCVHSAVISQPSLVQVGTPHGVINDTTEGRWCVSHVIRSRSTGDLLTWDEAMRSFAPWIKEKTDDGNS